MYSLELSGISAFERYTCNNLTGQFPSCFSNYQCFALPRLIRLTFDYVDFHVIAVEAYVATSYITRLLN